MPTSSLLRSAEQVGSSEPGPQTEALRASVKRRPRWNALGVVLPAIALIGWEVASRLGWLDRTITSSPTEILAEIYHLLWTGQIWVHLWATFVRVFSGFALGSAVAIVLGVVTGLSQIAYRLLNPTIHALRSVPSYAWVPLFILWFGIFETSKILLIALGAFFPLYLALVSSIRSVDRKLVEVALVNGFKGWNLARKIFLPASLPAIFVGLRQSLGLAWMFVVAAEFMGATHGLGFLLIDGQTTGRPATLITSVLLFALCGKATDGCLAWVSERALHWQDAYHPNSPEARSD
ncbi:MAG: ABC transporter permease [Verrucomicrobia bacterium]|nr:ABC transporter permease [Verrucomicrobiota bacterium]